MKLRLATFNLENLDDRPGETPSLEQRIGALKQHFQRLDADILCLQEVNAQTLPDGRRELAALDRLLGDSPYSGYHRVVSRNEGGDKLRDIQNLVVLSRYPIVDSAQIHHQLVAPPLHRAITADPPASEPEPVVWDRPLLHVSIDIEGTRLEVLNLHLRSPLAAFIEGQKESPFVWRSSAAWAEGTYLAAAKRCGQALEARLLVERLFDADPQALIAVCGDFNAEAREVPLITLTAAPTETGNAALAGRTLALLEASLPEDRRYTVRHFGAKLMLDHVLVSRGLLGRFRGAEILNELLADELVAWATGRRDPDSYHAPLVASFAF